MSAAGFEQLCGHLGMDPFEDPLVNIQELMNFTLQCLGGIKLLFQKLEQRRKSKMLMSLDDISEWKDLGVQYSVVKKVFGDSVQRMLTCIHATDDLKTMNPSRHIIESFPFGGTIGKQTWLAAHWAILGDPNTNQYDELKCSSNRNKHMVINSSSSNRSDLPLVVSPPIQIDDRIFVLDQLAKILPNAFRDTDREGRSVLHIAARLDSVPLFECALKHSLENDGPKISDVNFNGALPLHNTARFSQSLELLKRVEKEYPDAVRAQNHDGLLPLHWAAVKNRSREIIDYLMAAYPPGIRHPNLEGYLPMHCAGQNDCLDVVRAVYDAFPEAIAIPDNEGGLPLHHACCFTNNVEVVKLIYEAYPDAISVSQHDGVTPIHLAASQNDCPQLLNFLLEVYPTAASLQDNEGWTALQCVAEKLQDEATTRKLQCFRILLHANPAAANNLPINGADMISRLSLNAFPSLNLDLYHELNWIARKSSLKLLIHLARKQNTTILAAATAEYNHECEASILKRTGKFQSDEQVDRGKGIVLHRLCRLFTAEDSFEIPAGIMRKILKFI
jgi:ankyrin repeat protein